MLVNYTAVCCSWYVWKEKITQSQPCLRYRIFAVSPNAYIVKNSLFFSLEEHFADILFLFFLFYHVLVIGLACPHWQYSRMFSVSLCKFELYQHHRKSLAEISQLPVIHAPWILWITSHFITCCENLC